MKSALGPDLWFAGIIIMIPGRLLALWLEQVFWGVVRLTPIQATAVFVVIEVAANVLFWLLCARVVRSLRRRRPASPRQPAKRAGAASCPQIGRLIRLLSHMRRTRTRRA